MLHELYQMLEHNVTFMVLLILETLSREALSPDKYLCGRRSPTTTPLMLLCHQKVQFHMRCCLQRTVIS